MCKNVVSSCKLLGLYKIMGYDMMKMRKLSKINGLVIVGRREVKR